MNKYEAFCKHYQDEIGKFSIAFSFDEEDLEGVKAELRVSSDDDLLFIGYHGYIRRNEMGKFSSMWAKFRSEYEDNLKDSEFVSQMRKCRMSDPNHTVFEKVFLGNKRLVDSYYKAKEEYSRKLG